MAKKQTHNRSDELAQINQLIERLDGSSVPELNLDKSLEECRQLNDQFEHVHVETLDVETPLDYTEYGSILRRVKVIQKRLEEQRTTEKAPILADGRVVDAKFKGFAGFASRIFVLFDDSMTKWDRSQEALRRTKEVALREKARKEKERLERAAEKKAKALEAKDRQDEADAVREAVPEIPTPVVEQTNVPLIAGVSKPTKHYRAEITEAGLKTQKILLDKAIQEWNLKSPEHRIIPVEYWALDEKKLDGMARTLKGELELPDVKIVDTPKRAVRV